MLIETTFVFQCTLCKRRFGKLINLILEIEYFEVQMINLCVLQIYLCVMSRPMPMPNVIIDNIKLACV